MTTFKLTQDEVKETFEAFPLLKHFVDDVKINSFFGRFSKLKVTLFTDEDTIENREMKIQISFYFKPIWTDTKAKFQQVDIEFNYCFNYSDLEDPEKVKEIIKSHDLKVFEVYRENLISQPKVWKVEIIKSDLPTEYYWVP